MAKFRIDERPNFRPLTANSQVWIERIEIKDDGEIYYTEDYRQVSLVKLLKLLSLKQRINQCSPTQSKILLANSPQSN